MRTIPCLTLALITSHAWSAPQKLLYTHFGDSNQLRVGRVAAAAGEVDGDGLGDYLIGLPFADGNGSDSGQVRVHAGATGLVVRTLDGATSGDVFGSAVAGLGDLNGDGRAELLVGAPGAGAGGTATVFSGLDGAVLYFHQAASSNDLFGAAVAALGDVNSDGVPDYAVGAPSDGTGPNQQSGAVRVYSGADGALLWTKFGDGHLDDFGEALAGVGDVTGDNVPDLVVGAPRDDDGGNAAGAAHLVSGSDGATVWRVFGESPNDEYGAALDGAGSDLDGDSIPDLVVGTAGADYAHVLSGSTGALLRRHDGSTIPGGCETLGQGLCALGDVDGDGRGDYAIGDSCAHVLGQAFVHSGADGAVVHVLTWINQADSFGEALARLGDLTGDGRDEFAVGASGFDVPGFGNAGRLAVYSPSPPIGQRYCSPGVVGTSGRAAVISAYGSPVVSEGCLSLTVEGVPFAAFGFFVAGTAPGNVTPPNSIGPLCLGGPNLARFNTSERIIRGPTGAILIDLQFMPINPPRPIFPGETWYFQCWFRDFTPAGVTSSNFSDAVSVQFQ